MPRRPTPARAALWCAALSVLSLTITSPTSADTFEWTDPVSGAFVFPGPSFWTNITGADPAPPNVGDIALFNEAGSYQVAMFTPPTSDEVFVTAGSVTFREINAGSGVYDVTTGAADVHLDGGDLTLGILDAFDPDTTLNIGDLLEIQGGSTLTVILGSDVTADRTLIGTSGDGTAIFDGVGSTLTINSGGVGLGDGGTTGILTFQNGSTGSSISGFINLIDSSSAPGSSGQLNVLSGSTLQTEDLFVGNSASSSAPQGATLTVDGASSALTMTGASTLTIGDDSNSTILADTIVSGGGTFSSGTGAVLIQNSGHLDIQGGTFNANGAITMTSGSTLTLDGGALNANAGLDNTAVGTLDHRDGTLTVAGGAFAPNAGGAFDDYMIDGPTAAEMPHLVVGAGATASIGNDLIVGNVNQGELTVEAGGMVSNALGRIGNISGSTGTATVTGSGSTWTISFEFSIGTSGQGTLNVEAGGLVSNPSGYIGQFSGTGTATVTGNGSTWTNSSVLSVGNNGQGTLNVEAGGMVTNTTGIIGDRLSSTGTATVTGSGSTWTNSGKLTVANLAQGTLNVEAGGLVSNTFGIIGQFSGSNGTATVTGSGSTWTNSNDLVVGGSTTGAGGTGSLTVSNQGLVDVTGELKIWGSGTATLDGGSIVTDTLDNSNGGVFNFIAGSLTINDGITIGNDPNGVFPSSFALDSDRQLVTAGTTTIALFRTLTLDGGTLETGNLDIQGTLAFNSGTLGFIGAGGLEVGAAGPFGSSLSIGAGKTLDITNTLAVDAGATLSLTTGGNISAGAVSNSGNLSGSGTIAGPLTNNAGGEVQGLAGNNLVLTSSDNTNNGQVTLTGGQVHFTQDFTNSATGLVIGNGTLRADGGTTNDGDMAFSATANVIGDMTNNAGGTIISAGGTTTFFDDVTNNGEIRTNANSFSVYFGSYSGNGDTGTGTVILEGDLKPGSSPGTMAFGGDLSFGPAASLEIEIGGPIAGSEFDMLDIAGTASLDGTLDVSLLGGFSPLAGDTFEILSATGGLSGTFATENLPALTGQLFWNVDYDTLNDLVVLEVVSPFTADFDLDGDVDGNDLNDSVDGWQARFGADLGGGNFLDWQRQFGSGTGPLASSQAVPEPTSALLVLTAAFLLLLSHPYRALEE